MTTHQARVSGWSARGVFVPGREKTYSLRRYSSSTITSRQSVFPLCLALRSTSLVCGLWGGTYFDGPLGAQSCWHSAEKAVRKKTAATVLVSNSDVFRMIEILTLALHRLQSPRLNRHRRKAARLGLQTTTSESVESSFPRKRESRSPGLRDNMPGKRNIAVSWTTKRRFEMVRVWQAGFRLALRLAGMTVGGLRPLKRLNLVPWG